MGEPGDVVNCHRRAVLAQFTPPFAEPEDQLFAGHGHRYWPGLGQHSPLVVLEGDPAETRHQVLPALAVLSRFEARAQPARCRGLDLVAAGRACWWRGGVVRRGVVGSRGPPPTGT